MRIVLVLTLPVLGRLTEKIYRFDTNEAVNTSHVVYFTIYALSHYIYIFAFLPEYIKYFFYTQNCLYFLYIFFSFPCSIIMGGGGFKPETCAAEEYNLKIWINIVIFHHFSHEQKTFYRIKNDV